MLIWNNRNETPKTEWFQRFFKCARTLQVVYFQLTDVSPHCEHLFYVFDFPQDLDKYILWKTAEQSINLLTVDSCHSTEDWAEENPTVAWSKLNLYCLLSCRDNSKRNVFLWPSNCDLASRSSTAVQRGPNSPLPALTSLFTVGSKRKCIHKTCIFDLIVTAFRYFLLCSYSEYIYFIILFFLLVETDFLLIFSEPRVLTVQTWGWQRKERGECRLLVTRLSIHVATQPVTHD